MPARSRRAPSSFPVDRKFAAWSFSVCRAATWCGASCTGRTGSGRRCGPKYFVFERILWRVPNVTVAGRDDLASREQEALDDETDLDQIQNKAGIGRPERGLDCRGVCRVEGRKARRRALSFAAARR